MPDVRWALLVVAAGAAALPLSAQDAPPKTLLPGKGAQLTMAKCSPCHDITHVTRSRLTRDEWEDNLRVMLARGMPPLEAQERETILEYLSTYYHRDKPPPAATAAEEAPSTTASVDKLLSDRGCTACHTTEKRIIGPSFREVAQKYKGDAGAAARIASKIREGGAGAWGAVPMPPHPQIGDDELSLIAAWVLQQ